MTTEAQEAKERAIDQVQSARPGDYSVCLAALNKVIRDKGKYGSFSSEDVIAELSDGYATIQEPRVLGAVFRTVRASGRIYAEGYSSGKRKERHSAPTMIWRILRVEP